MSRIEIAGSHMRTDEASTAGYKYPHVVNFSKLHSMPRRMDPILHREYIWANSRPLSPTTCFQNEKTKQSKYVREARSRRANKIFTSASRFGLVLLASFAFAAARPNRSEERRVGKECRS